MSVRKKKRPSRSDVLDAIREFLDRKPTLTDEALQKRLKRRFGAEAGAAVLRHGREQAALVADERRRAKIKIEGYKNDFRERTAAFEYTTASQDEHWGKLVTKEKADANAHATELRNRIYELERQSARVAQSLKEAQVVISSLVATICDLRGKESA